MINSGGRSGSANFVIVSGFRPPFPRGNRSRSRMWALNRRANGRFGHSNRTNVTFAQIGAEREPYRHIEPAVGQRSGA